MYDDNVPTGYLFILQTHARARAWIGEHTLDAWKSYSKTPYLRAITFNSSAGFLFFSRNGQTIEMRLKTFRSVQYL